MKSSPLFSYGADIVSVKRTGFILSDVTVMSGYYFSELLKMDPHTVLGKGYSLLIWVIAYVLISLLAVSVCRVTYTKKTYFVTKICLAVFCIALNIGYAKYHLLENGTFCHDFLEQYVIPVIMLSVLVSAWVMEQWKKDMVIEVIVLFVIDRILCNHVSAVLLLVFVMGIVAYFAKRIFRYKFLSPLFALIIGFYMVFFMKIDFISGFSNINSKYLAEYDELYQTLEAVEFTKLLAPNDILRYVRSQNEQINFLYEVPYVDSVYKESYYDQKVCSVFESMKAPQNCLGGIVPVATGNQCDCLILKLSADERWEMENGGFEAIKETSNYVLYLYKN